MRRPFLRPVRGFRIGRWLALGVVCAIAFGYVQPVRSYFDAKDDLAKRRADRTTLLHRQANLQRRLAEAGTDAFVEREARRIGLVRPGETLYIVKGIDRWKKSQ